jgi:hypothetical protein
MTVPVYNKDARCSKCGGFPHEAEYVKLLDETGLSEPGGYGWHGCMVLPILSQNLNLRLRDMDEAIIRTCPNCKFKEWQRVVTPDVGSYS